MKIGDLVEYVEDRSVGIVVRRANADDNLHLWHDQERNDIWWVQFVDDKTPHWLHKNEMYILQKGK